MTAPVAGRDRLAERIGVLLDAPPPVLQRALVAVAVTHTLDRSARCACRSRRARPPRGCPTRWALWTAVGEALSARTPP